MHEVEELKKGTPLNEEEREKEFQWISALVEAHPVLSNLPDYVKTKLKVRPGDWSDLPVNKRKRKRLKKAGVVAHQKCRRRFGIHHAKSLEAVGWT